MEEPFKCPFQGNSVTLTASAELLSPSSGTERNYTNTEYASNARGSAILLALAVACCPF